jgi:methyl-accepting chemotaxis protein
MQIRARLTLQFLLMGEIIMIIASLAIYYSSVRFRQDDFYDRLSNKARSTARLLLDYGEIDAVRLKVIEKDNPINLHNEKIIILNYQGIILYSTDEKRDIKINALILEHVISGRKLEYRQGSYEVMGTLFFVGNNSYILIAAATDPAGIMHLKDLRTILIEVCIISLLLFGVVGWVYSGRALKPISEVISKVEDISITSLHLRVPEGNGTDEIGKLAKTFNKMLERLETSFQSMDNWMY